MKDPAATVQVGPAGAADLDAARSQGLSTEDEASRSGVEQGEEAGERQVGRYGLGRKLGAGACGAVYEGVDPSLDRPVAIKVVLPRSASTGDPDAEERLRREARALAQLGHPNVVQIYDVGTQRRPGRSDRVFIVMERIDGETLRAWVRATAPGLAQILSVYFDAADALAAAHSVGVVHRDFKPENVMVTRGGETKVLDFGLARGQLGTMSPSGEPAAVDASASGESLTRTGTVMGTPRYMAPEQHLGRPATAATDQYSWCVSLWESLTGNAPFSATTLAELAAHKSQGCPARPDSIPVAVYRVLARGLEEDPQARWPDLASMVDTLRRSTSSARRRRWPWVAGTSAAVGAVALLLALESDPPSSPAPESICDDASPQASWSQEVAEVVATLRAAEDADPTMLRRVVPRLTRFVASFGAARERLCESDLSGEELVARSECLARARARFEALLQAHADLPRHALTRRASSLEVPTRCINEDADRLFARSPEQEAELDQLYGLADDPDAGAENDTPTATRVARARELRDHFTAAALLDRRSQELIADGAWGEYSGLLWEATMEAQAAQDTLLAAELAPSWVLALVDDNAPDAEISEAFARTDEILEGADHPPVAVLRLSSVQARFHVMREEHEQALAAAARGEAAADAAVDLDPKERLGLLVSKGAALMLANDRPAATRAFQRITELADPDTQRGAMLLGIGYRGLGRIAEERGETNGALDSVQQHFDALARTFPEDHPTLLYTEVELGRELALAGRADEGLARLARAYHRFTDFHGDQRQRLAILSHWGTQAALGAGRAEEALSFARELLEHASGPDPLPPYHPSVAHGYLAAAHELAGDLQAAQAEMALAVDLEKYHFSDTLLVRGRLALRDDRPRDAEADAQRVLAQWPMTKLGARQHSRRADAYTLLAAVARHEGRVADAEEYEVAEREQLARGDYWHRQRLVAP